MMEGAQTDVSAQSLKVRLGKALTGSMIIAAMILFRLGLPAAFDKGHRIDDLLHGDALPLAAGAAALYTFCSVAWWFVLQRAKTHDSIRTRRIGFAVLAAAVILLCEAFILIPDIMSYRMASDLMARGVPAEAHFVRDYPKGCGKAACMDMVEYRFTPQGRQQSITGSVEVLSGHARGRHDEIDYVEATGLVPILYDPRTPTRAMFFWKNDVARATTIGDAFGGLIALNIVALIVIVPFVFIIRRGLAKQRRAREQGADQSGHTGAQDAAV